MVPVMDKGGNGGFPLLQLTAGVPAEEDTAHRARLKPTTGGKRRSRTTALEVAQALQKGSKEEEMGLCLQ